MLNFIGIFENGRVDYLSFKFNKYSGSFIVEIAVVYPYKGKKGNFYYWDDAAPDLEEYTISFLPNRWRYSFYKVRENEKCDFRNGAIVPE